MSPYEKIARQNEIHENERTQQRREQDLHVELEVFDEVGRAQGALGLEGDEEVVAPLGGGVDLARAGGPDARSPGQRGCSRPRSGRCQGHVDAARSRPKTRYREGFPEPKKSPLS